MTLTFDNARRRTLLRRSVRSGDVIELRNRGIGYQGSAGGLLQILVPVPSLARVLPEELPISAKERDRVLSITPRVDAQWGAAIGIAVTQVASLSYRVDGTKTRARRLLEILDNADISVGNWTGGWVHFIGKHIRDYLTTNNGAFFEVVRKGTARGSQIVGINHLSSIRCFRTGDPEYPVVYMDRWGRQHVLRWWEVVGMSDMPDPDDYLLGAGLCAAERAYQQIRKLATLETYVYEKLSGSRPLAIYLVSGMSSKQLDKAVSDGFERQKQRGLTTYMGAVIATTLKPDEQPGLVTIPLAELPDGFVAAEERDRADLVYANSIGLDPQDLAPIGGERQLGVGAQSSILHDKAKGRGLAVYKVALKHAISRMVADTKSKFYLSENDYVDQERRAKISRLRSDFVGALVSRGIVSEQEARQILVDWGEIPIAFVAVDITTTQTYEDDDKPALMETETRDQQRLMKHLEAEEEERLLEEAIRAQQAMEVAPQAGGSAAANASHARATGGSAQLNRPSGPARSGGEGTKTLQRARVPVRDTR